MSETEELYQILYVSSAKPGLDETTLEALLRQNRGRNADRGITGLLLHADGNIIQVLEGPETTVCTLYSKIEVDPRHGMVTTLFQGPIQKRDFPNFSMGFRRTQTQIVEKELPGFIDMVESGQFPPEFESLSKKVSIFLRTFAKTTRIAS